MKKSDCFLLYIIMVTMSIGIFGRGHSYAEIRRDRIDAVVLGEWQPPRSSDGRGYFLPIEDFSLGKKLAVKIRLSQPEEIVTVKFFIETPGKSLVKFKKQFQDNASHDLEPKQKILLVELMELPSYPVCRYIVEVNDNSGQKPIMSFLESPIEPSSFSENVGNAVLKMAKTLWTLPEEISSGLLGTERAPGAALRTLVVADTMGKILHVMSPIQNGEIRSPIWLSDDRILFVQKDDQRSLLKIIPVTLDETPEGFRQTPTEGVEPHLSPDHQSIIFRQGTSIIHADLSGTTLTPLVQDKEVTHILGDSADSDNQGYNLLFSAKKPDMPIDDIWSARIQGTEIISLDPLPYNSRWFWLAQVSVFGDRMLYERQDIANNGQQVWQIYFSQSTKQEGKWLIKDNYNNRYPAWSLDGTKIVFVSNREE
jgi:hypothetical protein